MIDQFFIIMKSVFISSACMHAWFILPVFSLIKFIRLFFVHENAFFGPNRMSLAHS